jgi:peptide deformylase
MTEPRLVTYPDPILTAPADYEATKELLRQPAVELRRLVADMLKVQRHHRAAGIAASQVGPLRRPYCACVVLDRVLVLPTIKERSLVREIDWEGCLSMPGLRLLISRPAEILINWHSESGSEHQEWWEGHLARVAQHEIDHLHGILISDRAQGSDRPRVNRWLKRSQAATG